MCTDRDLVPEMVFLLGRMGNNKKALSLIIERLGEVQRVRYHHTSWMTPDMDRRPSTSQKSKMIMISGKICSSTPRQGPVGRLAVTKDMSDEHPAFIRGLLENVGPEIDPIRLIRRIKDGLEIPELKAALIKILQNYNLQVRKYSDTNWQLTISQISLMEGCETILYSDCRQLSLRLMSSQTNAFFCGSAYTLRRAR